MFAEISGDYKSLHFNEAFAARTKFGRRVTPRSSAAARTPA
jgi:acyl dehydratase